MKKKKKKFVDRWKNSMNKGLGLVLLSFYWEKKLDRKNTEKTNHIVYCLNKNALPIPPTFPFPPSRSPINTSQMHQ